MRCLGRGIYQPKKEIKLRAKNEARILRAVALSEANLTSPHFGPIFYPLGWPKELLLWQGWLK